MSERKEKIFVTRASLPPFEEYEALIRRLWDTHFITNMGPYHKELREKLKAKLGVPDIELFVNGHMALELLIQAFSLKGEVITTPFTFVSTTHAIVRNGLKPVMCDVKESDGTLDPEKLEALITKDTCAIVPVHVYGNVCDNERIEKIAKKHGLKVIYDAAHAFGETVDGKGVATLGDASMFSFHATKAYNTIEGGAVAFDEGRTPGLADRLYKLKNFGITGKESIEFVGANAKMNEFAAAMGLVNLNHFEEWIAGRKRVYERYVRNLSTVKGVRVLEHRSDVTYNYAYMPIALDSECFDRDEIYERMVADGITPRKYFYPLTNDCECYRDVLDVNDTPVALKLSHEVLTLPIYPELKDEVIDEICDYFS
ncbi:MAG: DegT/DnrJ/EryC1/StrS family aminotransferase [Eubacteriales bacterium]|nr:DegT/DnrJ/EryC1/StrS family aminotransferase [Eubacteriales bacterium]